MAMKVQTTEYVIECREGAPFAKISGVLRLATPAAYEHALAPIRQHLAATTGVYTLDVAQLTFMNSSGITGLSRIVMLARSDSREMMIIVSDTVPWQRKTFSSLQKLYPKLQVRN
jgi:hypothetical protein